MLIYWLDEKEITYTECARRYRQHFAGETSTDDTIRKRHQSALVKLAKRYGLRPADELEDPGKVILRRGQQAGRKYKTIGGSVVYGASAGAELAGTVRQCKHLEPTAERGFLQACICVWKDTSNVSYEDIRERLARDYSYYIGTNTVQKLYYSERKRVYDAEDDTDSRVVGEKESEAPEGPDL